MVAINDIFTQRLVFIRADAHILEGLLTIPPHALGTILFAHGSGSSRHSTRNQFVAHHLNTQGLATLLLDLLTPSEERVDRFTSHLRFDINLLTDRLLAATDWAKTIQPLLSLHIGYFGASTGAAAALAAAAQRPQFISAVVSRGGRPDLAASALPQVLAPTLFIVGGHDDVVISLNQHAYDLVPAEKKLEIIPNATHLFEEPGALDQVAHLAAEWFTTHLPKPADAPDRHA